MENELQKPIIDIICGISAGEWLVFLMIITFLSLIIWVFKMIDDGKYN